MKKITPAEALKRITDMGISYVMEADSLKYLLAEQAKIDCCLLEDVLVIIHYDDGIDYVTVLPMWETLDAEALLLLISNHCKNPSILVNMQKLSADFANTLDAILSDKFQYERTITDYACTKCSDSVIPSEVMLLSSSHKEAFIACTSEVIQYRPPLKVLFELFVEKKQGEILAAFEGDKIIGYLSSNRISDTVSDVDYIYVIPEKRRHGIGKKLAAAYIARAVENHLLAYWSNAKNLMSQKTALSSGFEQIRVARKYIVK